MTERPQHDDDLAHIELRDVSLRLRVFGDAVPSLKQSVVDRLFRRPFRWRLYLDYAGGPVTDLLPHSFSPVAHILGLKMPAEAVATGGIFRYNTPEREVPDTHHLHLGLGHLEEAFTWLDKAVTVGDPLATLLTLPFMDPLRGDPRFQKIRDRVGIGVSSAATR